MESIAPMTFEVLQPSKPVYHGSSSDYLVSVLYDDANEIATLKDMDRESFLRRPMVPYISLDRNQSVVHTLYREVTNAKYLPEVMIPIYVKLDPHIQSLKKYGIETEQEAIALMSNSWLETYMPTLIPTPGDRVRFLGITYEVLTSKFVDYVTNSQVPLHRLLTLKNLPTAP